MRADVEPVRSVHICIGRNPSRAISCVSRPSATFGVVSSNGPLSGAARREVPWVLRDEMHPVVVMIGQRPAPEYPTAVVEAAVAAAWQLGAGATPRLSPA
jgi:hypothetical protein